MPEKLLAMRGLVHKIYGGLRIVRVCSDWPKWFHEYFTNPNDGRLDCYRMRCGTRLHTRRNRCDFHMIDEIWGYRKYDYFGYRVQQGDIVVDIGGNIGAFATYAAAVCRASRVLVFEPFPENFAMLTRNVEENGLQMVTCVNEAVYGVRGQLPFHVHSTDSGSHSLATLAIEQKSGTSIEVQCCTLADVFDRFDLDRIDYLKMDCEGAEYDILDASAAPLLRRVRRISMEYHQHQFGSPGDLETLLRDNGFEVRRFGGHRIYASRLQ
ncbi:MAG TPA: FkbM family methyltransferase [Candidatus Elarobacter sp.]|nr:FkbM family methyltransferase [Candidatus Elarobacter sp.]